MECRVFVCKVKKNHFLKNLLTVASFALNSFVPAVAVKELFRRNLSLVDFHRRKFIHELKKQFIHFLSSKGSVQICEDVLESIRSPVSAEQQADVMENFINQAHGVEVSG